uniref:Alkaline phosphatase n=1 Tax=Sinocyclocheilus rhinocerous TaxID=307959 RepID=A0A673NKJ8_9TELE
HAEKKHLFVLISVEEENPEFWRSSAQNTLRSALSRKLNTNVAKNIVLFLGDGMGVTTITAARILKGQLQNRSGEETVMNMDTFPFVGLAKVYSVDFQIPDSAATATAYLCGVKSNLNTVGVSAAARNGVCRSQKGNEVTSILKWAKDAGKSVGIVTTTRVQHATPAASYAHSASRTWYSDADLPTSAVTGGCLDIASQLLRNTDIDVIIGGGRKYMTPKGFPDPEYPTDLSAQGQRKDNRNLVNEWLSMKEGKVARYVWNKTDFDAVDPEKTDYLMGARIDQGHHDSRASMALHEAVALDDAVARGLELTNEEETLTVVTADHSHAFTFNGYPFRGNSILGKSPIFAMDFLPYTTLMYGNGPGHKITDNKRPDIRNVDTTDKDYVQQSATPLDSETHGGEDVALFARGPMAHLFQGVYEQNYIPHAMAFAACVGTNQEHCAATPEPDEIPFTSTEPGSSAPNTPLCAMTTVMLSVCMSVLLH